MANIKNNKRKLLIEFLPDMGSNAPPFHGISDERIKKLQHNNIRTIFLISSEPVDPAAYIKIINDFARNGFEIKSIHLDSLDPDNFPVLKYQVENIHTSFSKGGCLILSYGRSYALTLLGCFFIITGRNFDETIKGIDLISNDNKPSESEIQYIKSFEDFIQHDGNAGYKSEVIVRVGEYQKKEDTGDIKIDDEGTGKISELKDSDRVEIEERDSLHTPVLDEKILPGGKGYEGAPGSEAIGDKEKSDAAPVIESSDTMKADAADEISPVKIFEPVSSYAKGKEGGSEALKMEPVKRVFDDKKSGLKAVSIDDSTIIRKGNFYSSIRFKLVSIVTLVIVSSLTGMIFLATYFFKKDNIIRVQENNLNISDVIALKVNTDINTVIEKSKFLFNSVTKGAGGGSLNIQDLISDDNEIIFTGIIDKPDKIENQNPQFIIYNRQLINKMQLFDKDIAAAYNINTQVFNRSFDGAKLIYNLSKVMENQLVIAVSFPYQVGNDRKINSIAVIFIRLDNIMKTFNPKGITKTYMVNDKGEILIHSDKKLMQSGANMSNLPIVSAMIQSPLDNGQTRFKDESNTVFLGSFKKIGFGGSGVIAFSEEELALQEVYNIQKRNIYLMVSVLSAAVLIIFLFAKTLTSPITRLVKATDLIKEGHYIVDIQSTSKDEIGQLTASFVEMGRGLEERERMKNAFGKFVNKEIAEQVLHGEIRLGGERKIAAVFFSDIRSFTAISENLEPEEVVEFLNEYMTRMVKCVNDSNGVVDKYIGDAIMAEWGVPISKGNDTENAVNAALNMRRELVSFNEGRGGVKRPVIKIGCGINTGPVLAGQIGSEDRMEYTVIGDAVNIASRIEQLNKPFGTDILISEDSYLLVKDIFAVEKMAPITVKGKEDKLQIYAVLGRNDDPGRLRNVDELRKFLGITDVKYKEGMELSLEEEVKYEILDS